MPTLQERGFSKFKEGRLYCKSVKPSKKIKKVPGVMPRLKFADYKTNSNEYGCPHCVYKHKNRNTFQQHMRKHYKGTYICTDCNTDFHLSTEFRAHLLWKCVCCQKEIKGYTNYTNSHMKRCQKKNPDKWLKIEERLALESAAL